ncbi:phytanoyl-CoA dioxygenase family protein [Granulosicoccus antarcticus]|uniref:Fe2OG dioxygenase domain-containing protein n=1 Tax=Granulosicoccus antarcticus IMCC3135 TaxID=1192854 RepID=A0A2Z2NVQ7_9GAMM|nr:phytanoyl-CoA dioxygenase family protein [Granulosicoccus antarcticus]ASJ74605.1 hypothetical protein IMCC3135_22675 [Granulosicoccus antarcticus IMCC3135]
MNKKQFLSAIECAGLREQFDVHVGSGNIKIWTDTSESDVRVFHAEKKIPVFQKLYESLKAEYVESFGSEPDYSFLLVNRVVPKQGGLGSGGGWHRDSWFNQCKVFAFLSDVGESNGPLEYIPGSNSLLRKGCDILKYRRSLRVAAGANIEGVPVLLKAGQGFSMDTTVIHRGRPILEGVRYAATLYAFNLDSRRLVKCKQKFADL